MTVKQKELVESLQNSMLNALLNIGEQIKEIKSYLHGSEMNLNDKQESLVNTIKSLRKIESNLEQAKRKTNDFSLFLDILAEAKGN